MIIDAGGGAPFVLRIKPRQGICKTWTLIPVLSLCALESDRKMPSNYSGWSNSIGGRVFALHANTWFRPLAFHMVLKHYQE